ncbi:EthD family reductase [Acidiphilium acidophilum]|uniref:EthD family reductase n=1 Tax=Acidiphilium acidophilum TaxID=76588 RepID=A0AAW9DUA0_ACIAO|nr:EthD family reductase [Acidiphilium acidophilum]MDX5931897.1 EthD family reductase [Acidiphilium acidophilum]GBQ16777.1 ethyl tert-butyl ether degradation EthD [Acidiphilium acidophilum DSM 700]
MIAISVLYPKTATSKFDTAYYHDSHMKLVDARWSHMGLHGSRVMHGVPGPDGGAPTYAVITILEFESMVAFGKAAEAHGAEIMGDIANFTDVSPILQFNEIAV